MKGIMGNKFIVTLISVILCVVILYIGYNYRINQKVETISIPVAKEDIAAKTQIKKKLIKEISVPKNFLVGDYYSSTSDLTKTKKYVVYNSKIAEGSPFYKELVVSADEIPDLIYKSVPNGYTLVNYKVNMDSTYANIMEPDSYINIYFKANNDEGTVMFGKFLSNIKILAVKDANGQNVFGNSDGENHTPCYMMFALPDDMYMLFQMATYMDGKYGAEFLLVPQGVKLEENTENTEIVSSEDIEEFITSNVSMITVEEDDDSTDSTDSSKNNTVTTTTKKANVKTTTKSTKKNN